MRIHSGRTSGNYLTNLSSAKITLNPSSYVYDGNPKTPAVMVELNGVVLRPNQDYTVEYSDNMSAGTASVRINGMGPFEGSAQKEYSISLPEEPSTSITRATVTLPYKETTYTGSALTPTPTVVLNGTTLTAGTHYSVTYSSNTDRGTATVTITGISPYTGSTTATFKILSPDLASATVELNAYVFNYTGALVRPVPTVRISVGGTSVLLVKDTDYTVSYEYTGARGTAYAVVTGIGGYTGSTKKSFQIGKDFSSAEIDIGATEYPYTGGEVRPWATVTMAGQTLTDGVDFDLTYEDNVEVGVGRVIATGKGDYAGSVTKLMSVSNAENNAWKNLTFSAGMVRQTGWCKFNPGLGDVLWEITSMDALMDGSVIIRARNGWGYQPYPSCSWYMKFKFDSGHEFDFSGDPDNDGFPIYMKRSGGSVDIEKTEPISDFRWSGNARNLVTFADYGRQLKMQSLISRISTSSGEINVSDPSGDVVLADVSSPYSIYTSGKERLAYTYTEGGIRRYLADTSSFFSHDGKKFFICPYNDMKKIVTLNLKTPWVLDGDSSVQSVISTTISESIRGGPYSYFTYEGAFRFSPDGKYLVITKSSGVTKYSMSTPWDFSTLAVESTTGTPLVTETGSSFSFMQNAVIVMPHRHKLIIGASGLGWLGFRTFTI